MLKILAAGGTLAIATLFLFGPSVQNKLKLGQLEKSQIAVSSLGDLRSQKPRENSAFL
jgi:hypothetical protein